MYFSFKKKKSFNFDNFIASFQDKLFDEKKNVS